MGGSYAKRRQAASSLRARQTKARAKGLFTTKVRAVKKGTPKSKATMVRGRAVRRKKAA